MSNEASEYNELLDIVSDIAIAGRMDQEDLARLRAHLGYKPTALTTQRPAQPVQALKEIERLLTNLQPHIVQACHPDRVGFIDNYVTPALEIARAALAQQPQGSGEPGVPVFLVCTGEVYEGRETYTRHEGAPPPLCDFEGPLYAAPPSDGDRTHIADLIDTFEQLRKIVGTPEQDADALIAAVRTLAAPTSAQQATGSGQGLTDAAAISILGSAMAKAAGRNLPNDNAWLLAGARAILAAATQAQPEAAIPTPIQQQAAAWEMVFQTLCEVAPGWNHRGKEPGAVKAAQFIRELAAPTTGKREPDGWALLDKNGEAVDFHPRVREFFGAILNDHAPEFDPEWIAAQDRERSERAPHRCVEVFYGITGEQR